MPDVSDSDQRILQEFETAAPDPVEMKQIDSSYSPLDLLSKKFDIGKDGVANSRHNVDLMNRWDMSEEEELKQIQQGAQKIGTGFSQSAYESQNWFLRAVDDAAETLPGIGDSLLQGGIGGALGAGAGAALGAPGGLPGALTFGGIGWEWGFNTGAAKSIWEQSAGEMYGELRLAGVKRETARGLAYTFGSLNASLEFVGLHNLKGLTGRAMSLASKSGIGKALQDQGIHKVEKNILGRLGMKYVESVFTETTTEGTQQASTEMAKVMAGLIQKGKADEFTNWRQASDNIGQSMFQALGAAAVLGAAGQGAGIAVGKGTSGLQSLVQNANIDALKKLDGKTPKEILQTLKQGLDEIPNSWEKETDQGKVVYGPNNEVLIKTGTGKVQDAPLPGSDIAAVQGKAGQLQLNDIVNDPQKLIQEGLSAIYPQEEHVDINLVADEGTQLRLPLRAAFSDPSLEPSAESPVRVLNQTEANARLNQIESDARLLRKESSRLESQIRIKEKTGGGYQNLIDKWQNIGYTLDELDNEKTFIESGLGTTESEARKAGKVRINTLTKIFDKLEKTATRLTEAQQTNNELKTTLKETQQQAKRDIKQTAKEQYAEGYSQGVDIGFNKGQLKAQRDIRNIRSTLKQMVREVTNDREIKQKVFQYIDTVTTAKQAQEAIATVKERVLNFEKAKAEEQNSKERQKVFDKVYKMVAGNQVKLQSGHPVSKMPQETVMKLKQLKFMLQKKENIDHVQQKFVEKYGETPLTELPDEAKDILQLTELARNLYSEDPLTQNIAASQVATWIYDGKRLLEEKRAELRTQKEQTLQVAQDSVGAHEVKRDYVGSATSRKKNSFKEFVNSWRTWNGLLDAISPKDQNHNITKLLDETSARGAFLQSVEITTQNMLKFIQDRMPEGVNLLSKLRSEADTVYSIRYQMRDGSFRTENFTKPQILDLVMKSKDESLHEALTDTETGNGFTLPGQVQQGESTFEKFEALLDDGDRAIIQGLLDFYKEYHGSVSTAYRNKYGVDLPMRENYSPVNRLGYKVEAPFGENGLQMWSLLPGSSKTRQQSKLAVLPSNPVDAAMSHIKQWEYFQNYDQLITNMNHVLTDTAIRNHLRNEYGNGTVEIMDNFFERFVKNDPIPSDPQDSFWSALRTDISRSALGFRLSSMFTQLSSGTSMWENYSPVDIVKGMVQTILHPVETEQAMRGSAILRDRFKSGTTVDLQRALNSQGVFASTLAKLDPTGFIENFTTPDEQSKPFYDALNRAMFGAITMGDTMVARIFGGAVYHAELEKGATPQQAMETVERLMEQTQQSSSVSQTPVAMTNPTFNTLLGMFTQQPVQSFGRAMIHVQDFANGPKDLGAFMKLGHRIAVNWVVPGAMLGLVRTLPSWLLPQDDNDERERAQVWDIAGSAILGPTAGLPLIGDILQAIWFAAAKEAVGVDESKRSDFYGKNPLIELIYRKPYDAYKQWSKLSKQEEDIFSLPDLTADEASLMRDKAQLSTASALSSLLGIPNEFGSGGLSALDRLKEGDTAGAAMAMGGWSPGAVKQRQGEEDSVFGADPFKDLNKPETPYDMIKTYLNTLVPDSEVKEAQRRQKSDDALVDEMLKGLQQSDSNASAR